MAQFWSMLVSFCGRLVASAVVFFVGRFVIQKVMEFLGKSHLFDKLEGTVRTFTLNAIKVVLYVILVVSVISILGIPMASVVAVLASAGLAIGMAMQGSLSNLAGGLMLMIFKPFKVGDFVEASGATGTITELRMFYTVFTTLDNRVVTVPNGALMNANITNYSALDLRRVDLTFACAKSEAPAHIQDLMIEVMKANEKVLDDPAPFARQSGGTNEAMEFTVRAWCKTADYWDVYFDLTQNITEKLGEAGVKAPAVRVLREEVK
ncbi:MAG: mechanosensitive ion channel family protein [Firmicutes bacterium]|nr:mechanosensitive ion channel family protein [Bacillota bacterium]